ncbi:MAG: DNA polymerase IV [Bacteroidales bacterium]
MRKIIHIDMDAFFASIEQRDNPELRGKPVAVGGSSERGVVAAASYEARKYGVRSAMSSKKAKQKCPDLIFVQSNRKKYKEASQQMMEIFYEYTDLVEPLSIDEAFLDVTHNKKKLPSATLIAKEIKRRIYEKTNLTASAGVSINKFLAKIASDYKKPDGLFVIKPDEAEKFVEELAVEKIHGVGKVTAEKMHRLGIFTGIDLKAKTEKWLVGHFGKAGFHFYNIARAIDYREVNPNRIRKSVGAERTFEKDLESDFEIITYLYHIEKELFERVKRHGKYGKTLTLKIKYADFKQITRSKTVFYSINTFQKLHQLAKEIFTQVELEKSIRLLGLTVSNFPDDKQPENLQLTLNF